MQKKAEAPSIGCLELAYDRLLETLKHVRQYPYIGNDRSRTEAKATLELFERLKLVCLIQKSNDSVMYEWVSPKVCCWSRTLKKKKIYLSVLESFFPSALKELFVDYLGVPEISDF